MPPHSRRTGPASAASGAPVASAASAASVARALAIGVGLAMGAPAAAMDGCPDDIPVAGTILPSPPASSTTDAFGEAIAIAGEFAAIGRFPSADPARGGSVWLCSLTLLQPLLVIDCPDCTSNTADRFGQAVAMDADHILVGNPRDDEVALDAGAVWVFDRSSLQPIRKLVDPTGRSTDQFGTTVALVGPLAFVGSPRTRTPPKFERTGAVRIFDIASGALVGSLEPDPGSFNMEFGAALAIADGAVVVGAPGSAGVWTFDLASGRQISHFQNPIVGSRGEFGSAVAISGDRVVVGAFFDDSQGVARGSAWIHDLHTGALLHRLDPGPLEFGDNFGWAVAASGDVAIVTAPGDGSGPGRGAAWTFDLRNGRLLGTTRRPADAVPPSRGFGRNVVAAGPLALVASLEFQSVRPLVAAIDLRLPCPLDLDADGTVGLGDVLTVLFAWGPVGAGVPADLDQDGQVDLADLMAVLGCWAACPGQPGPGSFPS